MRLLREPLFHFLIIDALNDCFWPREDCLSLSCDKGPCGHPIASDSSSLSGSFLVKETLN